MIKILGHIIIGLILLSCKSDTKIDFYLTESWIETEQGIKVNEENIEKLGLKQLENRFDFDIVRYDTIKSDLIFAGSFIADKTELQKKTLITNKHISSFDLNNGLFELNSSGVERLSGLKFDHYGRQFVLFINNEPIIYGYFFPTIFSYWCDTYQVPYMPDQNWKELTIKYGKEFRNVNLNIENQIEK